MGVTKTHEQFLEEVKNLVGNEYTVLSRYVKGHSKIRMRHNKCSYEYEVTPSSFLYSARCPKCAGNIKITDKSFRREIHELVGDEYLVKSEYISNHKKVTMLHTKCNCKYDVTPAHFITTGRRCPFCNGGVKVKDYDFSFDVEEMTDGEYSVLSDYSNSKTHVLMKHNNCENVWEIRPDNFKSGKRCPYCNQSHGELEIARILSENKIDFIPQFKFEECKKKRSLPFDFAIIKNEKVNCVIEYNGEQHYRPVKHFGGESGYKSRIENDRIKKTFCDENKIPLLIIDYNENIEEKINTMAILSQA